MASSSLSPYKSLKNPNRVSFNSMYCATSRGSKAQLCLLKILHVISTVRPPQITMAKPPLFSSETKELSVENKMNKANNGSGFDLNGNVCIFPEMEESSESLASGGRLSPSSTTVGADGLPPLSGGGGGDQCYQQGGKTHENDWRTHGVSKSAPYKINENNVKYRDETKKNFALLIEAAKLVLGEFKDYNNSESESENFELTKNKTGENELNEKTLWRRSQSLTASEIGGDNEDTAPVLRRSKRGRTQVLPNRYRDSMVLEPLTRLSRHRSSVVSTKRGKL
ncbi:Uncharacterized protein Adt_16734 [Abeliophyllum distichum]|uniref:Uncharacterized protein n=1 Tax=Abeliophyllum distichum TaxID=126358 RepID=A0ABD1TEJ0_9LAMI